MAGGTKGIEVRRLFAAAALLLALLSGCSSASGAGRATEEVHVKLRFSRFVPNHIEVEAGTEVTFVVENRDPIDHEFLIGDKAAQRAHEKGTEAHHGAKPGEISVPAGETRTTTMYFPEAGRLLIGCHLPTHYRYGMRGDLVITN